MFRHNAQIMYLLLLSGLWSAAKQPCSPWRNTTETICCRHIVYKIRYHLDSGQLKSCEIANSLAMVQHLLEMTEYWSKSWVHCSIKPCKQTFQRLQVYVAHVSPCRATFIAVSTCKWLFFSLHALEQKHQIEHVNITVQGWLWRSRCMGTVQSFMKAVLICPMLLMCQQNWRDCESLSRVSVRHWCCVHHCYCNTVHCRLGKHSSLAVKTWCYAF